MRLFKLFLLTIFMITISGIFCSCNEDDNNLTTPITLKDKEGTTINLTYPNTNQYHYIIQGGDGNYSVTIDNPKVISAEIIKLTEVSASNLNLSLKVIGLGNAKVTITDKSQNSLILDITVDYLTYDYKVKLIDVQVTGGDLTENQKKAIIEKQLSKNLVKVGGGYKFIFNDIANKKGEATIYSNTFGLKGIKMAFDVIELEQQLYPNSFKWGYDLTHNEEKRFFVFGVYTPMTKDLLYQTKALIENVTETVQKEYPKAESVVIFQVVENVIY